MKFQRFTSVILAFFCFCVTDAQDQSLKFEHVDINSGLSQNHVIHILQDSRGFMWFGTRDGLNKYDGYKIRVYRNDPKDPTSISNNFISGIAEDSKGNIWVGTRGGGLNRYDRGKDQFERFHSRPGNPQSLTSDLITNLTIDHQDHLWICTENGLNHFEPEKRKAIPFLHTSQPGSIFDNNAACVFEDWQHRIWVGSTGGGLSLFNWKTRSFLHFQHNASDPNSLSNDNVRVIFEDSKRRLWIGTVGGGLDLLDQKTGMFRHFRHDPLNSNSLPNDIIYSIGEDNSGLIWIGTENGGLSIYNPSTGVFQLNRNDDVDHMSLSNNSVYQIYRDMNGNMWVGTFAGGVNLYKRTQERFPHYNHTSYPNSLSNNNVMCMAENDKGQIWMGTDGGGLNLFDPVKKTFLHFLNAPENRNSLSGNYVLSVCCDHTGKVWAGTWGAGVSVYDPVTGRFERFQHEAGHPSSLSNNNAWVIYEDRDKDIWVGCYSGGLNLYQPATHSFLHFNDTISNTSKQVYCISEDGQGNLLIGTDGDGVHVFNKRTKSFTRYVHEDGKNSLSDDRINYIFCDRAHNFWVGTMAGLNFFDVRTKRFKVYTTAEGLPNNVIFSITDDKDGNLWISTNHGLSKFDPTKEVFRNFTLSDGLQSYEFKAHSFCKAKNGALYFGGVNGFNTFFPDQIKQDQFDPQLVLTGFEIFNKPVTIAKDDKDPSVLRKDITETKEIVLPYSQSVFSFEFASLNYSAPEKRNYAYMLEGFDRGWNETDGNRKATYTNLDPGTYIFHVKARDMEEKWSSREVTVKVFIKPPFWLTWWFRIVLFSLVTGGVYIIYRLRVRTMHMQKERLEQTVLEQTRQLRYYAQEEHKARMEAEAAKQQMEAFNRELEQKNKDLEQFAYVASHDLQEPLRTTSGFADLLQKQYKGKLDDRADKYLSFLIDSTARMKVLIQDLLEYSRIGRKLDLVPVDCNKVLENVMSDLSASIQESNAIIEYSQLPLLNGYNTELKQLFQNLISNAIKFRKKETPPVISIYAISKQDGWQFTFKDNGIGIDPKHNDRIFVIFQRLHTRTEYPGSGIGLSNCKKIVELHKGRIWVESAPGEGSAFHFTIQQNQVN